MWLNKDNYKENLIGKTIVEVSGEGCANCLSLMPILNEIVSERNDVKLFHIEASEDTEELLTLFQIYSVPTVLVLNGLEVVASVRGFQPKEILELWIDDKLNA